MNIINSPPKSRKLPWISLILLFITYAAFGWSLYGLTKERSIWLLAAFCSTILGGVVTYPSRSVSMSFGGFFKTDTRAFILILSSSILSVLLLTLLKFFVDMVMLTTAGLLVSLDLKTKGWNKGFNLFLIVGWQLIGLSSGLGLRYLSLNPIPSTPEYFYYDYWVEVLKRLN